MGEVIVDLEYLLLFNECYVLRVECVVAIVLVAFGSRTRCNIGAVSQNLFIAML